MINNVELAFGSSNIIDHNHNISNVGLHLVQQVYNVKQKNITCKQIFDVLTKIECSTVFLVHGVLYFLLSWKDRGAKVYTPTPRVPLFGSALWRNV